MGSCPDTDIDPEFLNLNPSKRKHKLNVFKQFDA